MLACGVVALDAKLSVRQAFVTAVAAACSVCESFASAERHSAFKPPIFRA
jgi:hypothetical protein